MNKPIVWLPQEPMRKENGIWVSKGLNLAATAEYGVMSIVWHPDASILSREIIEATARKAADRYDEDADYMVAVGSPSLIAMLAWAIGDAGKRLRMLEWDKSMNCYYPTLGELPPHVRKDVNGNR